MRKVRASVTGLLQMRWIRCVMRCSIGPLVCCAVCMDGVSDFEAGKLFMCG